MKITARNIRHAASWGSLGLAAGLCYAIVNSVGARMGMDVKLDPPTDNVQDDPELLYLLYQLGEYRGQNEVAYAELVNAADRLMFRIAQISEAKLAPQLRDRSECFVFVKTCTTNLEKMVESSKLNKNPKIAVSVFHLYTKIYEVIARQWKNAMRITQNVTR